MLILILLALLGMTPASEPELSLDAQMGSTFATIDVEISLDSYGHPAIYYLALESGSVEPDVDMILAYAAGYQSDGLESGTAVRGHWIASSTYDKRNFALSGGENIENTPREEGFVDGICYDIYMIAIDAGGLISSVASAKNIMAMPFDSIEENVYIITQAKHMMNIDYFPDADYLLAADLDLRNWKRIKSFSGNLNGGGYTIKNLRQELFETLDKAIVQNLCIEGARVFSCGIMARSALNSTIVDCTVSGTVVYTDTGSAGGVVGYASGSAFKGCEAYVDVKGKSCVGGFAGSLANESMLVNCRSYGDVYGEKIVGGFVGTTEGVKLSENANHSIKLVQCHSFGDVELVRGVAVVPVDGIAGGFAGVATDGIAGGFAGDLSYTVADAVSASGEVMANNAVVGGFVGRLTHRSRITNACAYGDVNNVSGKQTGGFVGLITHGSGIEYAFSSGDVSGSQDTGGFAGAISSLGAPNTLFACLSFANWVLSDGNGSGLNRLIGRMDHEGVNNCYAYLGSMVTSGGDTLLHVSPNAYGVDGGDINNQTIEGILSRLGWDQRYWSFEWASDILRKPKLIQ